MPERQQAIQQFLTDHGWHLAERSVLADDASFRRYDRLVHNDGRRAVFMDAPPPQEDIRPFIQIANHLGSLGLSAPALYAEDTAQGFLLLEDFGDDTYTRLLATTPEREQTLYELAVDLLIDLHKKPVPEQIPRGLAAYTTERLMAEVDLLIDWYLPEVTSELLPTEARLSYQALWQEVFEFTESMPRCLVLRDFHVDNLLWLDARPGIKACGLLDFQDALAGPRAYDLMSLLEDARRDIPSAISEPLKQRYCAAFPKLSQPSPARNAFDASYAALGAGRHAKIIGIFTRLAKRDGKASYLIHIPRVWKLLERSLTHPMLASLADWFETYIPQPIRKIPARTVQKDT